MRTWINGSSFFKFSLWGYVISKTGIFYMKQNNSDIFLLNLFASTTKWISQDSKFCDINVRLGYLNLKFLSNKHINKCILNDKSFSESQRNSEQDLALKNKTSV